MPIHPVLRIHHLNWPHIHCIILLLLVPSWWHPNCQCRSFCKWYRLLFYFILITHYLYSDDSSLWQETASTGDRPQWLSNLRAGLCSPPRLLRTRKRTEEKGRRNYVRKSNTAAHHSLSNHTCSGLLPVPSATNRHLLKCTAFWISPHWHNWWSARFMIHCHLFIGPRDTDFAFPCAHHPQSLG